VVHLYLIRHAESEANVNGHLIGGRSDHSPLSRHGELQAMVLGKYLRTTGVRFDSVHSSTAVRAVRTAEISCEAIDFPLEDIVMSDDLLELSQGEWVGRRRHHIYTKEQVAIIDCDNWNFKAPGGESQRECEERMTAYINKEIVEKYCAASARVGLFGHGMAIKCFLRGIFGFDASYSHQIEFRNTSVTHLGYGRRGWYPITVNNAEHLLLLR